ncbi:Oidioi.mRNA.OKI2018_I69.PAR.g11278.t1.cds [Oikopleura dioica]|uniref:Oidioi.mRNA.OKI2018_I69.PAR.g11278.t1.cds n=1 Tax=Oikopleura dioica TaxID=34765 RepID=A0ABN7RVP4_OIKDI|nr:Oidioi.mRNA.OKI2018_I69.PAR.g11278.t1.cds [Oikopleura dioica]
MFGEAFEIAARNYAPKWGLASDSKPKEPLDYAAKQLQKLGKTISRKEKYEASDAQVRSRERTENPFLKGLVIYHKGLQYTRNGFAAFPIGHRANVLNEPLKILAESITKIKSGDWQQVATLIGLTAATLEDIIIVLPNTEDAESLRKQLCQKIYNAKLVSLAENEGPFTRFKSGEKRITGTWNVASVACDGEYESILLPCWAHPKVAELMFKICNGQASENWSISAAAKIQLRSNNTSWEETAAKRLDISIGGPFTTHIRDILMDAVKAAGHRAAKENLPAAEPENFFPNIWTPALQEKSQRKKLIKFSEA